ncbi:nicotinamide mononucleotide transporter [Candidatus Saccharibacteria bacterium]|nr:nicotinamide mononucleotide transporter [Candidatus Saccharibacteria bacterium]
MKKTKTKKQELKIKEIAGFLFCVFFPILLGYFSGDLIVGSLLLMSLLLCYYFASIGKRAGHIFGFLNSLLIAYVAYENQLYGSLIFNLFIFAPLEIYGFIAWGHNLDRKKDVKIRGFTPKVSAMVVSFCVLGSALLGKVFTFIPGQQLAFLDSTINCLDICGVILLDLRYKESWSLNVVNGLIAMALWIIIMQNGGENTFMRFASATSFMLINIYGAIKWHFKLEKKKR